MDIDDSCSVITTTTLTGSTTSSMLTSVDGSPAPSVYSYRSMRDGQAMLREIAGRKLNSTNELYLLPADEGEHGRLDKQHLVNLLALGGLYAAVEEVRSALAPTPDRQRAILDLVIVECLDVYRSLELTWLQALRDRHLLIADWNLTMLFTLGLEHYYNSFDVVHARCTANGVADFEGFIHEATKCVRPGGILLYTEGNLEMYNEKGTAQEPAFGDGALGQSWLARATFEAYNLMKSRGSAIDAGRFLGRWMESCPMLREVQYREILTPIGPWKKGSTQEETQRLQMMGTLMRQNMKTPLRTPEWFSLTLFTCTLAPFFQSLLSFYEHTHTNDPILHSLELDELSLHMYVKWHHAWGRRVEGPNLPTPAIDMSIPAAVMTADEYDSRMMIG
ncbi:hypothetical protein A7U60_g6183 [Sanghuangporus baumii]|uniref:Uncharacterized protein n=1 Tax=Sanghuangporus baumii TaxID=108892 RepID=A0A9Q5HVH6_SANBA|nr:hypothetical protein A7U60_g6183 [Sanghuangporus baumii]